MFQADLERGLLLGRRALADLVAFTPTYGVAMWMVSTAEVVVGDPAAALAVCAEARRLLAAEGGPEDWRTSQLYNMTSYVAGVVGDRDTERTEAHCAVAVARRLAIPTLLAVVLTFQGHALCDNDPKLRSSPLMRPLVCTRPERVT